MQRYGKSSNLKDYSFLFAPGSGTSQNAHYQYYDRRLRTQQTLLSNASLTSFATYSTPRFQDNTEPSTSLADLAEPISVFDDIKPQYHRSPITPHALTYLTPAATRHSSVSDDRFAVASAMRERLLQDIERSMTEIDEEIRSLRQRSVLSNYTPTRLTPLRAISKVSSHKSTTPLRDNSQAWPQKPKRAYQVIPRIQSRTPIISQESTPKLPDKPLPVTFRGEYHYGPEIKEIVIQSKDPENSDRQSALDEISQLTYNETLSLEQFSREQSDVPNNRVLISVPQYGDNHDVKTNQTTEEIHSSSSIEENTVRSSTVQSTHEFGPSNKLNIQDFQSLIQTAAPKLQTEISPIDTPTTPVKVDEPPRILQNTILTKPVKHSRLSRNTEDTITSVEPKQEQRESGAASRDYFFSDFGHEDEGEEDLLSIDPQHFIPSSGPDDIPEDTVSGISNEQPRTPLRKSAASKHQQPLNSENKNNNPNAKEIEKKKADTTTEHVVTSNATSASKKRHQISIYDDFQNDFETNKNNSNEHQRPPSIATLSINKNQQTPQSRLSRLPLDTRSQSALSSSDEPKTTDRSPTYRSTPNDQKPRSFSRHGSALSNNSMKSRSKDNLSQAESIESFPDITKTAREQMKRMFDDQEETPVGSRENSELPVKRTSPDVEEIPARTSRPPTPERRNSVSTIAPSLLLSSNDILTLEDTTTENPETTSSLQIDQVHKEPSNLSNIVPSQEHQHNNQPKKIVHEISSNQNQDECLNPHISPVSSITHEPETNYIKSASPVISEVKKTEDDDSHFSSLSRHHTHISDANPTSTEREDTLPQCTSLDETHKSPVEKPVTPEVEFKSADTVQPVHDHKPLPSSEAAAITQERIPSITASQRRSKLSLVVRRPSSRKRKSSKDQLSQNHVDPSVKKKYYKSEVKRHVMFSDESLHFQVKNNPSLRNWRERIDAILTRKQTFRGKYAYVTSRVNTFGNFEYQPKRFIIAGAKRSPRKATNSHHKHKTDSEVRDQKIPASRRASLKTTAQLFGRLWCLPDGTPKIFHEKLEWNATSKLRSYSMENSNFRPRRSQVKIFDEKPRWHSESRVAEILKSRPRQEYFLESVSVFEVPNKGKEAIQEKELEAESKIFDINSNSQHEFPDEMSLDSKQSAKIIYHKKLLWKKQSKLRDTIWENKDYQPQPSQVKIFHEAVHWNSDSRLRITHSLNMSIPQKIKYWSESDIPELTKNKALFAQYYDPNWNDIPKDDSDPTFANNSLVKDPTSNENIARSLIETSPQQTQVEVIELLRTIDDLFSS